VGALAIRPGSRRGRVRSPAPYGRGAATRLVFAGAIVFLYVPIVLLAVFSFNDSKRNVVWRGFTTEYYGKALRNADIVDSFVNSLVVAAASTALAVPLGAALALLLWRFSFRGKAALEGAAALPIVMPEICVGISLLIFFNRLGWPNDLPWPLSLGNIVLAHATFSFPFAALVARARLSGFNLELEQAARDLGATRAQSLRHVLLPHMRPGLVAGGLLAFTLSLDDFVITFFTAGPETVTFPIKIYSLLRFGITPDINAASTLLVVLTAGLAAAATLLQGRLRRGAAGGAAT